MKTEVILSRDFLTGVVRQKSKSGMFSATDLVKYANIKRFELGKPNFNLSAHLNTKSVLEFIEELQKKYPDERIIVKGKGRNSTTWVHPLLFIDIALAVEPTLKIQVYEWLYDELLKHRNSSGESYLKMAGALMERTTDKRNFKDNIQKLAVLIKNKCGVEDWNTATQEQLELRDKMHNNIFLLCSVINNPRQAIMIGIEQALTESNKK